ncbi:MAG: hypothetical protein IPN33_19255 [Saprospiraceae bacterium]|nr:hypothetical protein [Saprospiraceae bacterium]
MRLPLLLTLVLPVFSAQAQWPALEWSTTNPLALKAVVARQDGEPIRYTLPDLPILALELNREWLTTTDTAFLRQVSGKMLELRCRSITNCRKGFWGLFILKIFLIKNC